MAREASWSGNWGGGGGRGGGGSATPSLPQRLAEGVLPQKLGRGVRPASWNPFQNIRFSLPYYSPNQPYCQTYFSCSTVNVIIGEGLLLIVLSPDDDDDDDDDDDQLYLITLAYSTM